MGCPAGNLNEYSQNEATVEKKEIAQESAATEEKDNSVDQEPKKED